MQFESFEKLDVKFSETDTAKRLSNLHKGFESRITDAYKNYLSVSETAQEGLAVWIGENAALTAENVPEAMDAITPLKINIRISTFGRLMSMDISLNNTAFFANGFFFVILLIF